MRGSWSNRDSTVEPPNTTAGEAQKEQRLETKLRRSPGSYFRARARELVLAADYFKKRLPPGTYARTVRRHYHTLCGSTYAMLLSSFELTWKSLYARIIDATSMYDASLLQGNSVQISTEAALAHKESPGAGVLISESIRGWQQVSSINKTFKQAFEIEPIDPAHEGDLRELWQIRHIIAHGSGVTSELDSYRLRRAIAPHRALQLDGDYLDRAETKLLTVATEGVERVGGRLLDDFFGRQPSPSWERDNEEFGRLYHLGLVVSQTTELPEADRATFDTTLASRTLLTSTDNQQ